MSPAEEQRITDAAQECGRAERREQGIPEQITDDELTAKLADLLRPAVRIPRQMRRSL